MSHDYKIKGEDIEIFFEGKIPDEVKEFVENLNLKFRKLSSEEYLSQKLKYEEFFETKITPSGPKRQQVWQSGWGQNLDDVTKEGVSEETLLPYYYKRGRSLMRYQGEYIYPEDDRFEQKFLSIIQKVLALKYFKNFDNIYELGCGPCHNVFEFAKHLENKNFYVSDWVEPSLNIAALIEKHKNELGVNSNNFFASMVDLFKPDKNYKFEPNSIALTFGSMEQLGSDFENLLDFFLKSDCNNFIHLEPILEIYNREHEIDDLAYRYSVERNYLTGFYSHLLKLQKQSKIKIHCCQRIIGSAFHDGWTLLRWEKL